MASKICAFGREDLADLTGDHALMRTVLLNCVDNEWYGGAVFVSRAHFDTSEFPGRRNVWIIRGGKRHLRGLLGSGPGCAGAAAAAEERPFSERYPGFPPGAFERLCAEDAAALYDGSRWVPMRVEDCVSLLCRRFVAVATNYTECNPERVQDIAPSVEDMCVGYRGGSHGHHYKLSEAVAGILDRHALTPAEFLEVTSESEWEEPSASV